LRDQLLDQRARDLQRDGYGRLIHAVWTLPMIAASGQVHWLLLWLR
jgi:hypothetical protein